MANTITEVKVLEDVKEFSNYIVIAAPDAADLNQFAVGEPVYFAVTTGDKQEVLRYARDKDIIPKEDRVILQVTRGAKGTKPIFIPKYSQLNIVPDAPVRRTPYSSRYAQDNDCGCIKVVGHTEDERKYDCPKGPVIELHEFDVEKWLEKQEAAYVDDSVPEDKNGCYESRGLIATMVTKFTDGIIQLMDWAYEALKTVVGWAQTATAYVIGLVIKALSFGNRLLKGLFCWLECHLPLIYCIARIIEHLIRLALRAVSVFITFIKTITLKPFSRVVSRGFTFFYEAVRTLFSYFDVFKPLFCF